MSDNNGTALAVVDGQAVTTYQPQPGFTRDQIELIKTTIAKGVTDDELKLFISTAERRGLDPFARQIYAVKRKNRRTGVEEMTIQVAIDGLRAIADRHGKYAGQVGPFWCGPDGVWRDVWIDRDYPVAARVGVLRHDFSEPLYAVALWTEYCPGYDGKPERMWQQYPSIMLAKCAEALALRKAFPEQMGGLYTSEEMSIANAERVAQPEPHRTNGHARTEPTEPVITCEQAAKACVAVTAEDDLATAEAMLEAALAACKASVGSKADRKRLLEEFYLDAKQHVESLRSAAEASDTDAALERALASDDGLEG